MTSCKTLERVVCFRRGLLLLPLVALSAAGPAGLIAQSPLQTADPEPVIQLEAVQVQSYREGRSRALQEQRKAPNRLDIISADAVGKMPDQNIADALSRLPGISLMGDVGEGRFVSIRGINPNLNNVTVNGTTVASSGIRDLDGRDSVSGSSIPLDVIGSSQVTAIEVVKVVTPDMDANAIGGSINLRTASAFDVDERRIYGSLGLGYADLARDQIYDADVTFVDRLGANRNVAVALSANYSDRPFKMEAVQTVWQPTPFSNGRLLPQQLELLPEFAERKRLGFAGNIQVRPDDLSEYYLRINHNNFKEDYLRTESVFHRANNTGAIIGPRVVRYNGARADVDSKTRNIEQNQFNATAGFERRFGDLTMEAMLNYSYASQDNLDENDFRFRNPSIVTSGVVLDFNSFVPKLDLGVNEVTNLAAYRFTRWTPADFSVRGRIWTPQVDFTWQREGFLSDVTTFKFGAKYQTEHRKQNANVIRYDNSTIRLGDIPNGIIAPGTVTHGYQKPFDLNHTAIINYFRANMNLIGQNVNTSRDQTANDTWEVDNDITAVYSMGTFEFDRLTVLTGARYERTDVTLKGLEHQRRGGQPGPFATNSTDFSYDHFFPNLQFRYLATPEVVLRASASMTLARPEYEYASPKSLLNVLTPPGGDPAFPHEGSITIGNPNLEPYESVNLEVSLEYYLKNSAVLSIGGYHKRIDNPIYPFSNTYVRVVRSGYAFALLNESSYANADEATVKGVELAAFVPFTFLPEPFRGLGFDGNVSFITSEVKVPNRPEVLPMFEQPDRIVNLALFYEKNRIAFRLAYIFQTASLRELRGSPADHFYRADFGRLDAQISYRLSETFTLFANGQNLTNESQDTYSGTPDQMRYSRLAGTNYRAGIKYRF
jgi:TonB-dependent receptor